MLKATNPTVSVQSAVIAPGDDADNPIRHYPDKAEKQKGTDHAFASHYFTSASQVARLVRGVITMDPHVEDVQIMQRIAAHDQQALRVLYQRYGTAIYSLAFRVLQNETLAEEAAQ